MSTKLIYIADCKYKGNDICVFRDQYGKYHIKINGITTQKRLLANAIVRWFCTAMHQEPELNADGKPRMSEDDLNKKIMEGKDHPAKIPTIKLVRIELCCGLKEALNYCNKVWNR